MVLTPESFKVDCHCGRPHPVLLKKAVIAPGALLGIDELVAEQGYKAPVVAVYDENTYQATAGRHPRADKEVVLPAEGLHADEHGVGLLQEQLKQVGAGVLLAVGSGTIHDICRYVAAQAKIPFVSVPTAASVDGLVSTVAAMTWGGFKVTLEAVSPGLLVADLDVIAKAPWRLTQSGVGDVLGKYIALADWRIANWIADEYYCDGVANLTQEAVDEVVATYGALEQGGLEAYGSLAKALVLSGVAMQLAGTSRPASSAEHHISHMLELGLDWIGPNHALHGEKVGVGTILCAREYHKWAAMSAEEFARHGLAARLEAYTPPDAGYLEPIFGRLTEGALAENENDCLLPVKPGAAEAQWERIQAELLAIPSAEKVEAILAELGASRTLADIGVDESLLPRLLYWAPYARNRLSFMRLRHLLVAAPQ